MMGDQDWHDPALRCFGMLLDGRAPTTGIRQRGKEATILIVINGHHEAVDFTLPECAGAGQWSLLIDTNTPEITEVTGLAVGESFTVIERSLLVFVMEPEPAPTEALVGK